MKLQRVAVGLRQIFRNRQSQPAVLPRELQQLLVEGRKGSHEPFPLHLFRERVFLLHKTQKKKTKPVHQMRLIFVECALGAAEPPVILLSVFLNDPLEGTVRHIRVTRPKQKQIRKHSRKPPVAVLKRVDRKKAHVKAARTRRG